MRILLLSSADPTVGPGTLVMNAKRRLEEEGHEVTIYTKYPVEGHPEVKYIFPPETKFRSIVRRAKDYLFNHTQRPSFNLFYRKETNPPVNSDLVVNRIEGEYDMVYIYFIHTLLSFQTIKKLHDKYPVPFVFSGVDNWPFTGGCHFINDCKRYEIGCGKCPGMRSHFLRDFTYFNARYRRAVIDEVNPVLLCNGATEECYRNSFVTKGHLISKSIGASLDEEFFKPLDKVELRKKYGIDDKYKRILMFGCQRLDNKRKGMSLLIKSINKLYEIVNEKLKQNTLLVIVGAHNDIVTKSLPFACKEFGYVNMEMLAELYALADVYLSPSVVDPGPIMVNQALMCGTPVVSYSIGTALDVVKDRGTGYCAITGDYEDFTKGILIYLLMPEKELQEVSSWCRDFSIKISIEKKKARSAMYLYDLCMNKNKQ